MHSNDGREDPPGMIAACAELRAVGLTVELPQLRASWNKVLDDDQRMTQTIYDFLEDPQKSSKPEGLNFPAPPKAEPVKRGPVRVNVTKWSLPAAFAYVSRLVMDCEPGDDSSIEITGQPSLPQGLSDKLKPFLEQTGRQNPRQNFFSQTTIMLYTPKRPESVIP
jgi:hypothetical protein